MRFREQWLQRLLSGLLAGALVATAGAGAQRTSLPGPGLPAKHRTRLILRNGSYQVVMSYSVVGTRVKFLSAERAGQMEEIPLALVDLDATKRWETEHSGLEPAQGEAQRSTLDPELLKEEASRAALSPEVATDLRLAPEDSVLALDTFHGTPELVPLLQSASDLNKETGHGILRSVLNPLAAQHQLVELKGERSAVQLHVNQPVIYLRLDDELPASGPALTVDTHGASASNESKRKRASSTNYVIVRVEVRQGARVVASFNTSARGTTRREEDAVETEATVLAGDHWLKIVPKEPLLIGEYALMEVLSEREVNLGVWDFGIHPTAAENREAVHPEKRRQTGLERRERE